MTGKEEIRLSVSPDKMGFPPSCMNVELRNPEGKLCYAGLSFELRQDRCCSMVLDCFY